MLGSGCAMFVLDTRADVLVSSVLLILDVLSDFLTPQFGGVFGKGGGGFCAFTSRKATRSLSLNSINNSL